MPKPNFKKGERVKMQGCHEATLSEYRNKVWICQTDSFTAKSGEEVVFLEEFSGYFIAKYLKSEVQDSEIDKLSTKRAEFYQKYNQDGK